MSYLSTTRSLTLSAALMIPLGGCSSEDRTYVKDTNGDGTYQGPQGPQGPEGPQGPQGIEGVQGSEGAVGSQGPKGDSCSVSGNYVSCTDGTSSYVKGPKGDQGAIGSTGMAGPKGAAGLNPNNCNINEQYFSPPVLGYSSKTLWCNPNQFLVSGGCTIDGVFFRKSVLDSYPVTPNGANTIIGAGWYCGAQTLEPNGFFDIWVQTLCCNIP